VTPEVASKLAYCEDRVRRGHSAVAAAACVGWSVKSYYSARKRAGLPLLRQGHPENGNCKCGKHRWHGGACRKKPVVMCAWCEQRPAVEVYCTHECYVEALRHLPLESKRERTRPAWSKRAAGATR
jgi:hypothetical protein